MGFYDLGQCWWGGHRSMLVPEIKLPYIGASHAGGLHYTCAAHSGLCHAVCWPSELYPDLRARVSESNGGTAPDDPGEES